MDGFRGLAPSRRRAAGQQSEALVAAYLADHGWRVVARNVRGGGGELDIVALDGDALVFVEVRGRAHAAVASPAESVDWRKRRRLEAAARFFLARQWTGAWPARMRFDVVAVITEPELCIQHVPEAFVCGE